MHPGPLPVPDALPDALYVRLKCLDQAQPVQIDKRMSVTERKP